MILAAKTWLSARRCLRGALYVFLASALAFGLAVIREPLPDALRVPTSDASLRVLDRQGRVMKELRTKDHALAEQVSLGELSPWLVPALLAAEDVRFREHCGLDPRAMLRALGQFIWHRRIVSGASTLSQQLARTVVHRPRSVQGKLREMIIALSIERHLGKDRILEEYLNRVEFGPNIRGVAAASRLYFDKPAQKLDLAEAAALVAIPRGPTLYDPRRGTERVTRRRNRILERMRKHHLADDQAIDMALTAPVVLQPNLEQGGALHFVRALASGLLSPECLQQPLAQIETTLDMALQRETEGLVRQAAARMVEFDASAAAVLVVDNQSSDVLAYVGAPDFYSARLLGQNDGVRALRQPGSALKPFVYALALEQGMTAATLLPDIELRFPSLNGDYSPQNYDGRYHGPVRLREALASSLNVPAVYVANRIGPAQVLGMLRRFGFESLAKPAEHYGPAIALGDGEVRLSELASAYATLARAGLRKPLRFVRAVCFADQRSQVFPEVPGVAVLSPSIAERITDILSDDRARASSFGRGSVLSLPFAAAAKTGTSKGFRDNWAVGYTREVTVAVWVGNFDGRPMRGSSGVTGAGPLFRDVMLAAMRSREPVPLLAGAASAEVEICALSGELASADCPHRIKERFLEGTLPSATCSMHVRTAIDPKNGLRAGRACQSHEERVFERYPSEFADWARSARRPLAPVFSERCPEAPATELSRDEPLSVIFPFDGARFVIDPAVAADQQRIVLVARLSSMRNDGRARFMLDGRPLSRVTPPAGPKSEIRSSLSWKLERGAHDLRVQAGNGRTSPAVHFEVR